MHSVFSKKLRAPYRKTKGMIRGLFRRDIWHQDQIHRNVAEFGNEGARWCVCPDGLSASSVAYSFGVGEDISFDLELIRNFGTQVHAFDPTPRSIEWLQKQELPDRFVFHAYGVADSDGECSFHPPENPEHVSHTLIQRSTKLSTIQVPVYRLASIMKMLGHEQIDLIKMDIEGAEYGVLSDLLSGKIVVRQLLVEFHHRWREVGVEKTKQAIQALHDAGYRIFSVSPSGEEYSFLNLACEGVEYQSAEGS